MTADSSALGAKNPFEPKAGSGRRNLILVAVLVIAAVITALVLARRTEKTETASTHAHTHTATTAVMKSQPFAISPDAARRIGVTFAPVTLGPLSREIRTVAQVTFDETRVKIISPKVDGWVEQLYVNSTGQPVTAGQPLFAVYSPMLVSSQEELLVASRLSQSLSGASADARTGASEVQAAARKRLQYLDVSNVDIDRITRTGQVQRTVTLRSPVSGVVLEKNVISGQKIMAGEALYKVADLSTVWVEGEVFERDLAAIRVGAIVTAEFDALPGEIRAGRITYLYPTLNAETRTARVRVAMGNPGMQLKPGMYATIRIQGAESNAVSVPRSAVLSTGERNLVFVQRKDGMLEPRDVKIGESTEKRTRIISGVNVGDIVVASATFLVDAESNLGSSLGGMGDMPGMDITKPDKRKE